jgi:hypothetical protein
MPIQLMHLGPSGQECPVFQDIDGELFDLTSLTDEIDGKFLAADGTARECSGGQWWKGKCGPSFNPMGPGQQCQRVCG